MLFRSCLIVFELYEVALKTSKISSLRLLILRPDTERSLFNAEFLATVIVFCKQSIIVGSTSVRRGLLFLVWEVCLGSRLKYLFLSHGTENLHSFIVSYYVLFEGQYLTLFKTTKQLWIIFSYTCNFFFFFSYTVKPGKRRWMTDSLFGRLTYLITFQIRSYYNV